VKEICQVGFEIGIGKPLKSVGGNKGANSEASHRKERVINLPL